MFLRYFDKFAQEASVNLFCFSRFPVKMLECESLFVFEEVPYAATIDTLLLYKQLFVIFEVSGDSLSVLENSLSLFTFFSFDSRWFRYRTMEAAWEYEAKRGLSISISDFLDDALRDRRSFLLQFGQRRVCTRSSAWHLRGFFSLLKFESEALGPRRSPNSVIFTYKHLCKSAIYPAGVLLNQPNLVFFTQFLSNPYFWQVLQQNLHSRYRY